MIDIDVHKDWGSFTLDVKLHHEGGILGLLGASGCGKSKTLQCIAGIEKPDAGKVIVGARPLFDSEHHINVPVPQRRVGYLFQHYALFPNMTVEENIRCGVRTPSSKADACQQVRAMMERLNLTGLEKQKPSELSGGQQQRVALARILVNEPDILLLDEPFSALDSYLKEKVMTELKDLLQQFPKDVVLVTHSRDEAYQLCQSIAVLDGGRVSACAPTKELFADPPVPGGSGPDGMQEHRRGLQSRTVVCLRPGMAGDFIHGTARGRQSLRCRYSWPRLLPWRR